MAEITYIDTGTNELVLSLVPGKIRLKDFCVIGGDNIGIKAFGLRVNAHIIGASHIASISLDKNQWHEILACGKEAKAPNAIEGSGLLVRLPSPAIFQPVPGAIHQFRFSIWPINAGKTKRRVAKLRKLVSQKQGLCIGLYHRFPMPDQSQEAFTLVYVEVVDDHQINIMTAHAYPQEGKIVFSNSVAGLAT